MRVKIMNGVGATTSAFSSSQQPSITEAIQLDTLQLCIANKSIVIMSKHP